MGEPEQPVCVVLEDLRLVGIRDVDRVHGLEGDLAWIRYLFVHPQATRRGIGRRLLFTLLAHARDRGVRDAFLEVRRTNRAAIALYHDLGFECVGMRRGYYQAHEGREDALVYRLELGTLPDV